MFRNWDGSNSFCENPLACRLHCRDTVRMNAISLSKTTSALVTVSAFSAWIVLMLSGCNLYSSSARKSFNSSAGSDGPLAPTSRMTAEASPSATKKPPLSIIQRTHCALVESAAPLLLRGIDIVHAAEAWNVEADTQTQSYRFIWARRSESFAAVLCLIEPLSDYEVQHTLPRLPTLASHLSAELP